MGDASKIEWTDRSDWNPIRGCTRVSDGCVNCYAEAIAGRFSDPGQPFHGFATRTARGPRWTGKVELIENRLTLPLKWRKSARVFVNSAFDLFHESIPDAWIDRVFAVMAFAPQHTFQVLTKRAKRMREYLTKPHSSGKSLTIGDDGDVSDTPAAHWQVHHAMCDLFAVAPSTALDFAAKWQDDHYPNGDGFMRRWPLPNVWLGVSAEDQTRYDERSADLRATPSVVHFFSFEPLLGPIKTDYLGEWAIVGGESGRGARPMHPDWARSIRDQCAAAGVAFFFKQWGEWATIRDAKGMVRSEGDGERGAAWMHDHWHFFDRGERHGDVFRIGKSRAGRLLDGVEHNAPSEAR